MRNILFEIAGRLTEAMSSLAETTSKLVAVLAMSEDEARENGSNKNRGRKKTSIIDKDWMAVEAARIAGVASVPHKRSLKKVFYSSWQDAGKAARDLGIRSGSVYNQERQKDKLLPSSPRQHYKDFPGWDAFLKEE